MARVMGGTSSDKLTPGTGVPDLGASWTWAFWFKTPSPGGGAAEPLISRWTNSSTNRQLFVYGNGSSKIQVDIPFIAAIMTGATSFSANTWYHLAITRSATTSWVLYLNGASDATSSSSSSHETGGTQEFGYSSAYGGGTYKAVSLAEVALWNAGLTAAEVGSLSKGYSPALVRPASLRGYWPLSGTPSPEPDRIVIANSAVIAGTVNTAAHPRVIMPVRPRVFVMPAAAAAGHPAMRRLGRADFAASLNPIGGRGVGIM